MPYSILDLVFEYIETFFPVTELDKATKKAILNEITDLLEMGYTDKDILDAIRTISQTKAEPRETLNASLRSTLKKSRSPNLLVPGTFYYHNQLRIMPKPPKVTLDYNTGELKREKQEYFLEMRASYTVEDLVNYYLDQMKIPRQKIDFNRYVGAFNWLLRKCGIDALLFTIDSAANTIFTEDLDVPLTPAAITEYESAGREALINKVTENILSGDDRVVARKRVLSSRRRSLSQAEGL